MKDRFHVFFFFILIMLVPQAVFSASAQMQAQVIIGVAPAAAAPTPAPAPEDDAPRQGIFSRPNAPTPRFLEQPDIATTSLFAAIEEVYIFMRQENDASGLELVWKNDLLVKADISVFSEDGDLVMKKEITQYQYDFAVWLPVDVHKKYYIEVLVTDTNKSSAKRAFLFSPVPIDIKTEKEQMKEIKSIIKKIDELFHPSPNEEVPIVTGTIKDTIEEIRIESPAVQERLSESGMTPSSSISTSSVEEVELLLPVAQQEEEVRTLENVTQYITQEGADSQALPEVFVFVSSRRIPLWLFSHVLGIIGPDILLMLLQALYSLYALLIMIL